MMKKFFVSVTFIAMLLCCATSISAETDGTYIYTVSNNCATVTGVSSTESFSGEQTIPDTLGGYSVTAISSAAFKDCTGLTSITVPDSVTSIGEGAFDGCTNLESMNLPSLQSNLGRLFGCTTETSARLYNRNDYNGVLIRDLDQGLWIKNEIESLQTYYSIYQDFSYEYDYASSAASGYIASYYRVKYKFYSIPRTLKFVFIRNGNIPERAFYNCYWIDVPINDRVDTIGDYAFSGCSEIWSGGKTYTLLNTISYIGENVFDSNATIQCYSNSYAESYANENGLEVEIINASETIGTDTFHYIINEDNTAEIVGCETTSTAITIPLTLGGVKVTKIGDSGFKNCTTITGVTITDHITEIGPRAFYGCTAIEDVTIPTTVTSVGDYAFYGCTNLETVTISEGLKSIGNYAFYNCSSITEVTLPDSLETLGSYAFYGCTSAKSVTIGVNLIGIEEYTFYGCTNLATAVIGTSVGYIGDYAFYNTAVARITLPAVTKSIGNHAFENCNSLARMQIRSGLETIGAYAFSGDSELYQISIPASISKIGEYAFNDCVKITKFTVPDAVTRIENSTFNGCTTLATVTLGDDTTYIGKNAFSGCAFDEITLPETLTQIDDSAFSNCKLLTSIYIPDSVEKIGLGAFYQCNALNSISVADKLGSIGKSSFYMTDDVSVEIRNVSGTITDKLFEDQSIVTITMNEGITTIGNNAFSGCQTLTTVNYPESLVTIGNNAFYDNIGYSEVNLPDNVEYIGDKAYGNCTKLTNIDFSDKMKDIGTDAFINCKKLAVEIRCVDGSIEENLLNGQNVFYVSFPDTIEFVGNLAFEAQNDIDLTITYEDGIVDAELFKHSEGVNKTGTIYNIYINDGIKEIGQSAFAGSVFVNAHIYGNVENIESCAFMNSTIKNACFEGTVDLIGQSSFENSGINTITFMKNVGGIGDRAFYNCLKLTDINFWGELKTIGSHAFGGCKILPAVVLPETVSTIGEHAFYDCNSMTSINIPDNVSVINEYTFYGCSNLKEAVMPDMLECIGGYAYYGCTALENLELNDSIKSIGEYSFYNCNALNVILLPTGIDTIGNYAFRGCIGISKIIVPDTVTILGDGAFYACTGLEEVYVGKEITSINDKMFYGCVALKKATISDDTDYIEDYAFYGCDDCVLYCADNSYVAEYADFNFLQYFDTSADFVLSFTPPIKSEYYQGEELDLTGMVITVDYGEGAVVIDGGYTVTGYDSSVVGTQTVTVEYKGESRQFTVEVLEKEIVAVSVTGITLSETALSMNVGETSSLTVTITPEDATNKGVIWTSSNESIVIIEDGTISAVGAGEATITATTDDGGYTAVCTITVSEETEPEPPEEPDENAPTLRVGTVTGKAGETVNVPISIENNPGVAGIQLTLTYDEELTLSSITKSTGENSALGGLDFTPPADLTAKTLTLPLDGIVADATNGEFLVMTFVIPEDAVNGTEYSIEISYSEGDIYDNNLDDLVFAIVNGNITVSNFTIGDVNDDGIINIKDITLMRRAIAGGYGVTLNGAADVNKDGITNIKDITLVRRYIAGGYGVELGN